MNTNENTILEKSKVFEIFTTKKIKQKKFHKWRLKYNDLNLRNWIKKNVVVLYTYSIYNWFLIFNFKFVFNIKIWIIFFVKL